MTEMVIGKPVAEARGLAHRFMAQMRGEVQMTDEELGDLIALKGVTRYPLRVKCATMGWHALQSALDKLGAWSVPFVAEALPMANMNHVILAGNLTRDPESRQLPSGTSVADLGLAINESYKNKSGEMVETTCFVDVVVWGRLAETCSQFLRKGSPILLEGKLQLDQWTTQEGEKRSKLRVRADRVQFLSSKRSEGGEGAPAGGGGAARAKPAGGGEEHPDDTPF